jgi:signal transduction histidine kinase
MPHSLCFSAVLATLMLFCVVLSCNGQDTILLADPANTYRLDARMEVYVDTSENLAFPDILKSSFQSNFQVRGNLTFGYLKHPIWLKIKTKTSSPKTQWYLEIPAPFLEYVDFYQPQGKKIMNHSLSGYYLPHGIRQVLHTGHVVPLKFNTDSVCTVFIRIAGQSPKTFPVYILEKEKFIENARAEDLGYGIFFGILIVMFFYNLIIFLTLKQINYLLYICTIVCTFLIFSSATGYAGKYLWPNNPQFSFYFGRLILGFHAFFLSIFTIRFLEVKHVSKTMYYILLSIIPLAFIAVILIYTKTMSSAGNNLISIATIVFMATGIVCSVKGNKSGYYYIAAWTIYLAGGLLLTLRNSGIFDFNFWTTHFVEIGAALETIIIAFALGDRFRRYKLEKEEAQLLALQAQQEAKEKLERKVEERTLQLSQANKELQETLETNKLQTRIIEDKNAELDAFFYRISHDLRGPISSMLGLSFLAKREVRDEQALTFIEKQSQQVERLDSIINGLIKLTKLNDIDLQKEKIDFDKLIDECITSFSSASNFNNLTFRKEIQAGIAFNSEWTLLNAILQNLIENAIKYARQENPYVKISVRSQSDGIDIEVEDNGQGIPTEHQTKIFQMFYRASQSANGTGLGLYILKRSVDRLGGTITIKSEVGVGSTFTVKLPALISEQIYR